MKGLIQEEIARIEEVPLSRNEMHLLRSTRKKTLTRIMVPYFGLIGILIYVLIGGASGRMIEAIMEGGPYAKEAAWFFSLSFILLNLYFGWWYKKSVVPLSNDIKKGTKLILFLKLEKREPFFNRYFIFTPVIKHRQLELSAEDYLSLRDGEVQLAIAPCSLVILQLLNEGQEMSFRLRDDH